MGSFSIWHWVLVLVVFGAIGFAVYTSIRSTTPAIGIGGWLIFPIIGFAGTMLLNLFNFFGLAQEIEGLSFIFSAAGAGLETLRAPVLLSLAFSIGVIVSAGACLFYIFTRRAGLKHIATLHYVVLFLGSLTELWCDYILHSLLPETPIDPSVKQNVGRAIIGVLIWIPYFHFSKRVRNTFEAGSVSLKATDS